jgi:DNA-binding beta-propeller fold protein YncE
MKSLISLLFMIPAMVLAESPGAPRTGNGEWLYEIIPGWGSLPDGTNIGPTHGGVVVDPQTGLVYVSTNAAHGILVYKPDGEYVRSIAPQCQDFHSMEVHVEDGKTVIYGTQLGGPKPLRVCKIDTEGKELLEISEATFGEIEGGWNGLTAATVAPDGSIFVAFGYGSNLIHKFSAKGEWLLSFGGPGQEDGKFRTCHGLSIDSRGDQPLLLVVDRENRRLVHFDLDGKWIGTHSIQLRRPCTVSIHGEFAAVAELAGRVTILDKHGVPVAFLGDNANHGQRAQFRVPLDEIAPDAFTSPHGITFDAEGNLYVQVWNIDGLVVKLRKITE